MAYMDQELKKSISNDVVKVLKKYNVKGTLSIQHNTSIVLKIIKGEIDFISNYIDNVGMEHESVDYVYRNRYLQLHPYQYYRMFSGKAKEFLDEVYSALNKGNHDRSDSSEDYSDVGWFVFVQIGKFDKPYGVISS